MWGEFDLVGRWFGPYRVVQAGWAPILYAHDPLFNRYVAIVFLQPPPGVEHHDFLFRLERETRILRDLEHPNILPVYDCGYAHEHFYMVTALPTAETLSARLKGPLPLRNAGPILHGIASAMDAVHSKQLFHGDIKPANILIDAGRTMSC
jgi:serine/threonine protein kinase